MDAAGIAAGSPQLATKESYPMKFSGDGRAGVND